MTNQTQGEILFEGWKGDGADPKTWVYTPWMPVQGDFGLFAVEITYIVSGVTLQWEVQTRTREDVTANAGMSATQTATAVGIHSAENTTALEELFRYRIATNTMTASKTDFVVVRALPPSWEVDR